MAFIKAGLSSESIQSAALPLQGVDDIHGSDGLPLGMFSVGDRVPDHVLQKDLEDSPSLFVDQAGDALDSTSPRQTSDGRLRDTLDVVPQHLPVTLGPTLPEPLSSFASSSHDSLESVAELMTDRGP